MHRRALLTSSAAAVLFGCTPTATLSDEDAVNFWTVVDALEGGPEARAAMLSRKLTAMDAEARAAFGLDYWRLRNAAYSWALWGAGYLLEGGMSDDGFEYFLAWLISQGSERYATALNDPDSLASFATPFEVQNEDFLLVATEGVDFAEVEKLGIPFAPSGTPWEETDLPPRFPKVAALVGGG